MIDRLDRLALDIDLRLREVWEFAFDIQFDHDTFDLGSVGVLIRAAYGKGYMDALQEPVEASLCRDHGYRMPKRTRLG